MNSKNQHLNCKALTSSFFAKSSFKFTVIKFPNKSLEFVELEFKTRQPNSQSLNSKANRLKSQNLNSQQIINQKLKALTSSFFVKFSFKFKA
ncbi:hypothetical protein [Campylobacter troglodytis]|uniref:hypothetical protein n=1 Tax=Campylobacter troglodytis TaxID=654363 RepID=UPI00115ACAB3|nr:hypothetical protein [Campylobacter troglodytis]TQR60248.1 hypothetical protein DMC01_06685 [Campylobacter troglodytis]